MLSAEGQLLILASAVIRDLPSESITIFDGDASVSTNMFHKYSTSKKTFGIFQFRNIKVVLILCRDKSHQNIISKV